MGDRRTIPNLLRSASAKTPQHRPSYSARTSRSPGIRTPLTVAGLTSNSEHNRRQATENAAKVLEFFQSNRTFFNRFNFNNVGLKSMTSSQFIEIIPFFMVNIAGKNFLSKSRPNNHEDVIIKFIQDVKYPFAVNKACFKSPSSHQFYPEVIAILAFLSDLMSDIKKYTPSFEMPLKCCDRLLNDEFTKLFAADVSSNYPTNWKEETLLNDETEAQMINRFIAIKMKNAKLTVDNLAEYLAKLNESNERLRKNLIETDVQKCFASVSEQMLEKEKELQKLQEILADKRTHLKMIKLKHEECAAKLHAKQSNCNDLIEQIENQKFTILDIKQLMAKEVTIKNSMAMIKEENEAIKVQAADAQVKLARLQKLKMDMIKRFNDVTYQIAQKLCETSRFQRVNVNDLTIDPTASVQSIQRVCIHLHLLTENCSAIKRQYNQQIKQNREKMTAYTTEFKQLNGEYTEKMDEFQMISKKFDVLNYQYKNCDGSTDANRMQREIDEQIACKEHLIEQIKDLREKICTLQAENIEVFNSGDQTARDIIRAKRAAIKQMNRLSDFIDDILGDDDDDNLFSIY